MARARTWKCQRQTDGDKCGATNPARRRKCGTCGKTKPARRQPSHLVALDLTYEQYVELNGGDQCAICSRPRSQNRKLDRDHDHKTGKPRGLLCPRCNRALPSWITPAWLLLAHAYLIERTEKPK